MRTRITIRTDEKLRRELARRAAELGKSLSELVREILQEAVADQRLSERTAPLRGALRLTPDGSDPWRNQMRERNWRS